MGIGMIDAFAVEQSGVGIRGQGDEDLQVVADDFGGDILCYGLLGQSVHMLQIERKRSINRKRKANFSITHIFRMRD